MGNDSVFVISVHVGVMLVNLFAQDTVSASVPLGPRTALYGLYNRAGMYTTVLYYTALAQYSSVQCCSSTSLCISVQYSAVQCSAVQHVQHCVVAVGT